MNSQPEPTNQHLTIKAPLSDQMNKANIGQGLIRTSGAILTSKTGRKLANAEAKVTLYQI